MQSANATQAFYFADDIFYLIRSSPYLQLSRERSAHSFLQRQADAGEECKETLASYPQIRIEALDFFYTCLQSLGAPNRELIHDLLRCGSWRGVVWGTWLALLAPHHHFAEELRRVEAQFPEQKWLIACALAEIEGQSPPLPEFSHTVHRIRICLAPIPRPSIELRQGPSVEQLATMERERKSMRELYRRMGADAVRKALPSTLLATYFDDLDVWRRKRTQCLINASTQEN